MSDTSASGSERKRCPECGTPVETREPFDHSLNTRLQPCNHIVAAADLEAEWSA